MDKQEEGHIALVTQLSATYLTSFRRVVEMVLFSIYRRKKDKKKIFSGLGLVRKVKNCDLGLLFLFVCKGY